MKTEPITDAMIGRYLSGEASEAERALLRARLQSDPTLVDRIYLEAEREAELRRFFGQATARLADTRPKPARTLRWRLLPLAAAAAAVIGVGIFLLTAQRPGMGLAASMTLTETAGETTIERGSRTLPARAGMRLRAGDMVRAGADGYAVLTHAETEGTVRMQAESALTLTRVPDRFFLTRGAVDVEMAARPGRAPLEIETTRARAAVTGTRFAMTARPELTQLAVRDGTVDFTHLARNVTVQVPALHWAMAAPGADPQIAPLGADLSANYIWDFSEPADPDIFKVFQGAWRHNPNEQCMEAEAGNFDALINLPLHGLPLVVEYELSSFADPARLDKDGFAITAYGSIHFDRVDRNEAILGLYRRPTNLLRGRRPQWGPPTVSRIYVSPSSYVRTDKENNVEQVYFSQPGHLNNRLVFSMGHGPNRLRRLSIRSVRPEEVPDATFFRQAIDALPASKRKGSWFGPDPRPDKPDRQVEWLFKPFKASPFNYAPWQSPDLPANYNWDFSEPADPDIFKVYQGAWRHVPKEQCMEAEDGSTGVFLDLPVHGQPWMIEIELSSRLDRDMKYILGNLYFDRQHRIAGAMDLRERPMRTISPGAQWSALATTRFFVYGTTIIVADDRSRIEQVGFYDETARGSRLVFLPGFHNTRSFRLHRFAIRSVRPEDVPDVALFRQAVDAMPESKRQGQWHGPDPRPDKPNRQVRWVFQSVEHKMTPFEYAASAPAGRSDQ